MMHEHDPDLIAAFAEGSLDADQAPEAGALIASCSDCRTELEAQRAALAAVTDAPRPQMTGAERSELHRAINREAAAATRTPWYLRLAPALSAAAVLVLVVGIAGVMLRGSSTEAEDAAPTAVADLAAPEPTSEASGTEELAATQDASPSLDLPAPPVQPLGKISTEELQTFLADARVDTLRAAQAPPAASEDSAGESFLALRACIEEAESEHESAKAAVATYTAEVDETPVEIYLFEDGAAVVLETPECAVFFESPAP